jgi:hypothetical protein
MTYAGHSRQDTESVLQSPPPAVDASGHPRTICLRPGVCCGAGGPRQYLASDEEASGSNPATTPTSKPQVTPHPVSCGSRFASAAVRSWKPNGSEWGCWRA